MVTGSVLGPVIGLPLFSRLLLPRVGNVRRVGEDCDAASSQSAGDRALGPQINLFEGLGSALATQSSLDRLMAYSAQASNVLFGNPVRFEAAQRGVARIEGATANLEREVTSLIGRAGYGGFQASSNHPGVQVTVTGLPESEEISFRVLRPARAHQIASSPQADPLSALGLAGNLILEGEQVEVASEDHLVDLATAINEAFEGSEEGVEATVDSAGRLIVTRKQAGPAPIRIQDPDGVASALGLVETNAAGNLAPRNELRAPQGAIIEIAGQQQTADSNRLADLFAGLEIDLEEQLFALGKDAFGEEIEQAVDVAIRVQRDLAESREAIFRFVEAYNRSMGAINEETLYAGSLAEDRLMAAVRSRLIQSVEAPVGDSEEPESSNTVEDIGLEVIRAESLQVSELTLRRLALFDASGHPPSPLASAGGAVSIIQSLGRLGISQADDGTLQVDRTRLDEALQEEPALVERVLRGGQSSVLPRLSGELERIRDPDMGILARRSRWYSTLDRLSEGITADAESFAQSRRIANLQETLRTQIGQLQQVLTAV